MCATTAGLTLIGPGKERETVLGRDRNMAVTSPFPLDERRILCAATVRNFDRKKVDLGPYIADATTGKLSLLYNDPSFADFEGLAYRVGDKTLLYGDGGDYPWRLDQDITTNIALVGEVITAMQQAKGGDLPESALTALHPTSLPVIQSGADISLFAVDMINRP